MAQPGYRCFVNEKREGRDSDKISCTRRCPALLSAGVGGAEAGTLTFMVGGKESQYHNAQQYLRAMGKNIVHCGDIGTGQVGG